MASARSVAGVLALVLAGSVLSGCSGDDEPEPTPSASVTESSPTPSETAEPSSITVGIFGDRSHLQAYSEIVKAFRVENPAVTVEVERYPDARAAADAALASLDSFLDLDVFLADDRYLAELVRTEGLEPVDALLEERGLEFGDDYQRVALTAFSADSRLQCMPAEVSPQVVYVNTDLVRQGQLGVEEPVTLPDEEDASWTWEEFVEVARAAAQVDGGGPIKGGYLPPDVETMTAMVRSAGGDIVDDVLDPATLTLGSDEARAAIAELTAFVRDTTVAPSAAELQRRGGEAAMFADGRLALFVGSRADLPTLREADAPTFDVLPLPSLGRSRSVSQMTGWCLDADSTVVDVAADFIAYAVGPEGSRIAASSGAIVPSGLDVVHDEVFTQPELQPRNSHVYASAIRRSDPMPYSVEWGAVADQVEQFVERLWTKGRIDEEALGTRLEILDTRSETWFGKPEE